MKIKLEITRAVVITGSGPDKVYLYTDKTEWCYPFKGKLVMTITAAAGEGAEFVYSQLGIAAEIIVI